ncbi:hypothetical protein [Halalkalibacter krulwichiae]|nr:hypothetical protein [Halalkalibacter krulwichiae]
MSIILSVHPQIGQARGEGEQASLIVKSSSRSLHQTVLNIKSPKVVQALLQAYPQREVQEIPGTTNYILVEDNGLLRILAVDLTGNLYDVQQKVLLHLDSNTEKKIISYFERLHLYHFGQPVNWEEVDDIIPRYTTFTVIDLETGLRFKAQRRAGNKHADVQPLTKTDTAIMKEIYGGKWSWKRRAVVIQHKGYKLAGSMHGMPHGGGALANGFPGHFCIHFKDSVTHSTRSLDLSHQLMVHKAAGDLSSYVNELEAQEVVEALFIAINQHDLDLLNIVDPTISKQAKYLIDHVESIRFIKKNNPPTIQGDLVFELPLRFKIKQKGRKEVDSHYTFLLRRESPTDPWRFHELDEEKMIK